MRFIILFLYAILLTVNIHAQKKRPPVTEIIQAVKPSTILETDGFKIDFPARPTRTIKAIETDSGKTNMVSYQLATTLAFYGVNFIDFPTVITDKAEIDLRFEAIKTALLKSGDSRLISDTEIIFGDNPGIEYVIENKTSTLTIRTLIIKQRVFSLVVATTGKVSKATERVRNFNRQRVERFFNSFSVTELPPVKSEAVELPKDFGIKIDNLMFKSEFFGFSVELPENWNTVEKEQTDVFKDLSVQDTENAPEKLKKSLDFSLSKTEILLFLTKSDLELSANNSVFMIAAEKVSFPNFLPIKIAETYLKNFVESDERTVKTPSLIKFGGAEFAWVELENLKKQYKQRLYFANRKGIAFEILLIYRSQADLKTMLDSLQTIKFSDDK